MATTSNRKLVGTCGMLVECEHAESKLWPSQHQHMLPSQNQRLPHDTTACTGSVFVTENVVDHHGSKVSSKLTHVH